MPRHRVKRQRGGVLISVLCFVVVTGFILAGIGQLVVSHYMKAGVESDYVGALYYAEAGINYELNKISNDDSTADQAGVSSPPGVSYTLGSGSYRVYCTNRDGTTPWTAGTKLYIISKGTVNGVSRTVKIAVKTYPWVGKYAVYTVDKTSFWNGSAIDIYGDVGTNNVLDFSGFPQVHGDIYFNGPSAGWYGGVSPGSYTVHATTKQIKWYSVDQIALQKYPAATYAPGGLSYIATHNKNAQASPAIVGNAILGETTLYGPGDYYVTNIQLNGQRQINFDNTNGAVNLWIGPSGGTNGMTFRGGTAAIALSADPTKLCSIYVATKGVFDMGGNSEMDALLYDYNKDAGGNEWGYISNSGTPSVVGQLIANEVDLSGNCDVTYVATGTQPATVGYYGFDNYWAELNGAN
jgi:hypothetical protein